MPRYFLILFTLLLLTPSAIVSYWYLDVIYSLNLMIIVLSIIFGFSKYSLLSTSYRVLLFYVLLIYLSEIISAFSAYFLKTNMLVSHITIPIQLTIFSVLIYRLLNRRKLKWGYWILAVSLLILLLVILSIVQGTEKFNSIGIILFSVVVISSVLFVLKEIATSVTSIKLKNRPEFWFSIGSLVFYSVTFFLYGFMWMPGNKPEWTYTLIMYSNLFMSICYLLSIYKSAKSIPIK